MKEHVADELIECMTDTRLPFHYYPDRYAPMILSYQLDKPTHVRQLRNSPFGKLLERPVLRNTIATLGNGIITRDTVLSVWPPLPECYLLTLGKWGRDTGWRRMRFQTSRPGTNLVLQLNFSSRHDRRYERLVRPKSGHPFECRGHPIARDGHHTLAWARLDVDLDRKEALIEEIQSDWFTLVNLGQDAVKHVQDRDQRRAAIIRRQFKRFRCNSRDLQRYIDQVLAPHAAIWAEATLAAAIWFLKEEMGVNRVFYHTFLTGNLMKGISKRLPPRSLYTDLPKKFCFIETNRTPAFVTEDNRMQVQNLLDTKSLRFYMMDLP